MKSYSDEEMSSVVKHAYMIPTYNSEGYVRYYTCSNCGATRGYLSNYCEDCGAKIDDDKNVIVEEY